MSSHRETLSQHHNVGSSSPSAHDMTAKRRLVFTETSHGADTVVVRVTGDVDLATADQLDQRLERLSSTNTIVDLSGTTFLAVVGVRILTSAARRARATRHTFAVAAPTRSTARVLWLTTADTELAVHHTVSDAVRDLRHAGTRS